MVGLSDIPCVGKAVDKISEATVEAGIRGLRYLLCYKSLVNNLNSEIVKVQIQEDRVSRKADAEKADGKTIEDHVMKWQKEVEDIKIRAEELSKHRPSCNCFNVMMFPNPVTRFRLGRKAAHEANNVAELTLSGENLLANEIAYLPAVENIPISDTTYQKFRSREEAYGKLWEALVKEDGNLIIGIYGMPGVGKTRMMEQAWEDAIDKKIFDKVTRANVGAGIIDVIKLQNQLAGYLDCHLESEDNEVRRASQLKHSLVNGGKTLVILDDVWDLIPLKNIGIPVGDHSSRGCKILLTSRREDVCLRNDCTDPIKIETLTIGEARDMFKNTVGTSKVNSLQNTSLAEEVSKECAGLPLLIHAVANALKFVTEDSWIDALFQLQNCNFEEIDGIESRVYTCIQLSFDKLNNAAKTCLLLCSLFAEDAEIKIKMLEDLATGSQLLNRRRNVRGVVDNLKSSSLLLEGKSHRTVKMHDIIRDVARSIAAKDQEYAFLFVWGDSRLPDIDDYTTRKLLQFVESNKFGSLTGMVCADLHTLWLECNNQPQLSNSFVKGIENLKILVLKGMHIFREQVSLQTFDKLTTLILDGCDLNVILLHFIPENLETLRILECRLPYPLDFSKVKSLRKLQVLSNTEIEIVPNSVSSLPPTLAELHIPGGFKICDIEGKGLVPISSELNKLTALTSLYIHSEDSESFPAAHVVANLRDFIIHVGDMLLSPTELRSLDCEMRSVIVSKRYIEGGGEVLERAEEVILSDVKGSPSGFSTNNYEAFSTLKRLYIHSCEDIEHLAWVPHYEIQQTQPPNSFSKLTSIEINNCSGLKYLFCACAAKGLVQLQELRILSCTTLEVVIRKERAIDGVIIKFPKLKSLVLHELQNLRRFYGEIRGTCSSSTTIMVNDATTPAGSDSLFDGMVAFPALEILRRIQSLKTSDIWEKNCYINNSFCQLKSLTIFECPDLEFAIPLAMLNTFQNLENLTMGDCASMISEVESSSNGSSNVEPALVALLSISLSRMPALTRLNSRTNLYPKLEKLYITSCKSLRYVFLPSIAKDLMHLKKLTIQRCEMMREIIGEEEERNDEFVFPELTILKLDTLANFRSFCFTESIEAQATTSEHQSYLATKVSFPKLEVLLLDVKTIILEEIELGRNDSTSEIKKLVVWSDKELRLPYKWQLKLPNIEKLSLKNCWWHGSSEEHNVRQSLINPYGTLSFQRLKEVKVHRCGVSTLFSCSVFMNLHQLEKLEVTRCRLLEEVVREENNIAATDEKTISLFQLKSIELKHLPMLKNFSGSASYKFNMPALTSINVCNCPQMENFTFLEISTPLIPDFSTQIQKYLSNTDGDCEEESSYPPPESIKDLVHLLFRKK